MMVYTKHLLKFFLIALAYFVLARCGLLLASVNEAASPVWPASGFAMAILYLDRRYWISILIGAFVANLIPDLHFGFALTVGLGNLLEGLAGALWLQMSINFMQHKKYSFSLGLILISILAPFFSASIGVFSIYHFKGLDPKLITPILSTWWIGDALGILVFFLPAKYLIELIQKHRANSNKKWRLRLRTTMDIAVWTTSISFFILYFAKHPAFAFLLFPLLLYFEYKKKAFGAITSLFFMSLTGVILASKGLGLFSQGTLNERLITLQMFIFSVGITAIGLQTFNLERILKKTSRVLIIGWSMTAILVIIFVSQKKHSQDLEFNNRASDFVHQISFKMNTYINSLDAGKAFLKSSNEVDFSEWKSFVDNQAIVTKYPEIMGIGIVWPVERKNLNSFVTKTAKQSLYPFEIKTTQTSNQETIKDDLFVITMIEPWEINQKALGLDLGSEPNRRKAAESSRDLGTAQMTDPIQLVQDQTRSSGFLIFVPFYKTSHVPETIEERRQNFWGWIYAPFTWKKFFAPYLDNELRDFNFSLITANSNDSKKSLAITVFSKDDNERNRTSLSFSKKISIAGKDFEVNFSPSKTYMTNVDNLLPWISLVGCLITMSVAFVIGILASVRARAERIADARMEIIDKQQAELVSSSKLASLGEMAAGIAHEINNPLAIISTKASIIRARFNKGEYSSPKNEIDLLKIEATAMRVAKIIKALRSYSRNGENDPFQAFDLNTIVADTIEMITEKFSAENIKLIVEAPKNPISVDCKSVQIFQVILNMIGNSFDAVKGTESPWIKIQIITTDPKYVQIKITDSGKGISAEVIEKIFNPFFTTKEVGKGTGLGLSISMNIIKTHSGTLKYDHTSPNTSFVIQLPYRQNQQITQKTAA